LRSSEIKVFFEKAGFEIFSYEKQASKMPEGFNRKIKDRFRHMSEEELNVLTVSCIISKP
jgi:hypothetical protein